MKASQKELQILRKVALFPRHFPVISDYKIILESEDSGMIEYEMEDLKAIFNQRHGTWHEVMLLEDPVEALVGCLTFVLDCLYSLYLLHEHFGFVHSDISLWNIMYSESSDSWKLIDFDQSLELEESVKTSRTAGTPGFTAPESLASGIFTKASDVFSLGRVIHLGFFGSILKKICVEEYDEPLPVEIVKMGHKFINLVNEMISPNPTDRPSTTAAIVEIAEMLEYFDNFVDNSIYPSIQMLIREKNEMKRIQLERKNAQVEESTEPKLLPFAKKSKMSTSVPQEEIEQPALPPTPTANIK